MARRVIDKFCHNINRFRPIIDEDRFTLDYGRLSKVNVPDGDDLPPDFLAYAHMVMALGAAIMDLEAQQKKSALTGAPTSNQAKHFLVGRSNGGQNEESELGATFVGATATLNRADPANDYVLPLGHSTLSTNNNVDDNTDGVHKEDSLRPRIACCLQLHSSSRGQNVWSFRRLGGLYRISRE
ncbi:hypothetical protein QFC19_005504 [Naganishia cerealis]|uniref:Uncharacterized protein n=1 Tax=Naganishia cerealis TaxID=610337 RepID=A0ACC2VMV6_9TREE|nr:hypothetical protein QFC19_005504 [Naganishia cerealis]